MTEDAGKEMKARLRADLGSAMKAGRKDEAGVIRELIAALDNAEAVPARVEQASLVRHDFHRGSAEAERRVLGSDAVRQLFLDDVEKREKAAEEFDRLGRPDAAGKLRAEAQFARRYLD